VRHLLLLLLLASCGGEEDCCGPPSGQVVLVSVVAGATQRAEVGKELPEAVVVRATDSQGHVVPGQLINFVVATGGGSVFAGTAQTNAAGEARERWTMGTVAGEQVLEARVVDATTGDPIVFARVTATADPGPVVMLTLSGERQIFLGEMLEIPGLVDEVKDRFGNSVDQPAYTVSAQAPFAVEGTSVSSPIEVVGEVTLSAGEASATLHLTVVRNLTALTGSTGNYSCTGLVDRPGSRNDTDPRGVVTRVVSEFVVDSAVYPGLGDAAAALWITNTYTVTRQDGSVEVSQPFKEVIQVPLQEPGAIFLGLFGRIAVTSESPLTYVGDSYCPLWYQVTDSELFTIVR
jgi:hypothetical protein